MEKLFWEERWKNGEIGFHQAEFNAYLNKYWHKLESPVGATVFIPLAGKTSDIIWFTQQGFSVIAIELSYLAVETFFKEHQLSYEMEELNHFCLYKSDNIRFYCGDFFQLRESDLLGVSAVYDRASLIALPFSMREKYTTHLKNILPKQVNILLITMEYMRSEMDGPPFSVFHEEVAAHYQTEFDLILLGSVDILDKNQRFRERGLSALKENVYMLKQK